MKLNRKIRFKWGNLPKIKGVPYWWKDKESHLWLFGLDKFNGNEACVGL